MGDRVERSEAEEVSRNEASMSLEELDYCVQAFSATVKPVVMTMILAALSVIYISTPESRQMGEASIQRSYTAIDVDETSSNQEKLGVSLINGLVIVCSIGAVTFGIVLLYKYRCMKILLGYMILASVTLLGLLSSYMFDIAIQRYSLRIDKLSFALVIYNFAIVGTMSIFFGHGIPPFITQTYLIFSAVIVAWQLSHFDPWTAWMLLVLLALYDIFAVMSPCGPLKALIKLMQRNDSPHLPGLLYEASIDPVNGTPRQASNSTGRATEEQDIGNRDDCQGRSNETVSQDLEKTVLLPLPIAQHESLAFHQIDQTAGKMQNEEQSCLGPIVRVDLEDGVNICPIVDMRASKKVRFGVLYNGKLERILLLSEDGTVLDDEHFMKREQALLPLAIVRLNKLPYLNELRIDTSALPSEETLKTQVTTFFRSPGWRIRARSNQQPGQAIRYEVLDPDGEVMRIIFVSTNGKVFEELQGDEGEGAQVRDTVRLGLGDFIFYSILVTQAALYSFTSFVACLIAISVGLGMTLAILAVQGRALPALPISIFLGVAVYISTRFVLQPWVHHIFITEIYV